MRVPMCSIESEQSRKCPGLIFVEAVTKKQRGLVNGTHLTINEVCASLKNIFF